MKTKKERYLALIPALNAANTIKQVMLELKALKIDLDILVIDNNSKDGTLKVAESTINKYKLNRYRLIRNTRNLGYGGSQKVALFYGIYNNYDKLIIIHADNQYPVDYIPSLIKHNAKTKAAMTIGTRLKHKSVKKIMPKWRYIGNYLLSAMNRWAYNLKLDEFNSEFRIYDLHFMRNVNIDRCGNLSNYSLDSIIEIRAKGGIINQIVIPCSYPPGAHHPAMWDLAIYAVYNVYRAIKFKLFKN